MRGVVVVLGNFDGVHLGHQAVLQRGLDEARERGAKLVAATFDPHPRAVLWPGDEPKLLTTLDLRGEELRRQGADEVYAIRFDKALSQKSPEEFVGDVLVGEMGAGIVVVGENFRFGYRASGDFGDLRRLMREAGGDAFAVSIEGTNGAEITSTRIRALISAGDVEEASRLLGRSYLIRGEVVEGDRRGRQIGFPTANVLPDPAVISPARGVYAGFVRFDGETYTACTNIGVAPTFDRAESRVEAHLLDFVGDLYGKTVDVGFTQRIREERRFSGIEKLRAQIARDVEVARKITDHTI